MLQKSPKQIRKSFATYKGGTSTKSTRMVGAWSAHGRRHGARGLIPEGKPYSAPFISLKIPSFAFLSLFVLAFSCSFFSLQRLLHFRAMPLTCISFTSSHSCFLSAPCFASPACIASSASSGMMLAVLGVLSSIRHPQKYSFLDSFLDAARRCYKNRLNQSANPSPLIREGPA